MYVWQLHDWKKRAESVKNPELKYLGYPFVWKTAQTERGNTGLVYKIDPRKFNVFTVN